MAFVRFIVGLLGLSAVVATFLDSASRSTINPFNFFGFFTIQSNVFGIVVVFALAAVAVAGLPPSRALDLARACATTYLVIVGIVYNTILAGLAGGVALPWANTVLHVVMPIYFVLDWAFVRDRRALEWRRFWVVLVYPLVWLAVVVVRGATDGWVPYPFLDPGSGYGAIALYAIGIGLAFALAGSAVWASSRMSAGRRADDAALR